MHALTLTAAIGAAILWSAAPGRARALAQDVLAEQVAAADHGLEAGQGGVRVESTWVLAHPLARGARMPVATPVANVRAFESASFAPELDEAGRLVGVRARRDLPAGLHRLELLAPIKNDRVRLPMPASDAINRVRLARSLRFTPRTGSGLEHRIGIIVADDIPRSERRRADRALDGRHAHRRLGAVYVRGLARGIASGGLDGTVTTTRAHHRSTLAWVLAAFGGLLTLLALIYRRLSRAADNERVDAFLEQELGSDLYRPRENPCPKTSS